MQKAKKVKIANNPQSGEVMGVIKSSILTISVLMLSSCAGYSEQVRQENIQNYKNQCLQAGIKAGTEELSQCVSINIYRAQAAERVRLFDVSQKLQQQQQLEMVQRVSLR